ncbi:hypothetical protein VTI28DRAFT_6994 [Corynascus sepedonium]
MECPETFAWRGTMALRALERAPGLQCCDGRWSLFFESCSFSSSANSSIAEVTHLNWRRRTGDNRNRILNSIGS